MTRAKKKRSPIPVLITLVLVLLIAAIGGLFAYDRYIRETHPIKYQTYVEKYSREFNVNRYLVYSVIKTESGFRPDAVSNVGARGLMQIMEDTFEWIKFKLGDEDTVYYDMYDPETNIRYGCFLLGYLCDEFGNIETAMAAYHAGRGCVNEWLEDRSISSDGVHLDVIPIADTAHYVNKITKAMDNYLRLYDN